MQTNDQRVDHFKDSMAEILKKRVEFPRDCLVTVIDAELTSDLRFAKLVLSVLPISFEEQVLDALKDYHHDIVKEMANRLKMRKIPKLHWAFDRTEHKAEQIETYIEELKEKGEI
ncbi:ribosome-binding factor A [Patescibacteria group bacterium]|nr:ribosome-binding factor A [Patescibacteria group bacterium]